MATSTLKPVAFQNHKLTTWQPSSLFLIYIYVFIYVFIVIDLYVHYSIFIVTKWITNESTVLYTEDVAVGQFGCRIVWIQSSVNFVERKKHQKYLCYIVKHTSELCLTNYFCTLA